MESAETENYQQFLMACGRVTVCWALLESIIDICVLIIFKKLNGNKIETEIPRSLRRKIRFLKSAYRKTDSLAAERDEMLSLLSKLDQASKDRHDIIHGAIAGNTDDAEMLLRRFIYAPTSISEKHIQVSSLKINSYARDAMDLAKSMLEHCQELTNLHIIPVLKSTGE